MAAKKKCTAKEMLADEDLDELLLNPEVLKKRPAPRKFKRQSGNKETVTMARERQNMRSNQSTPEATIRIRSDTTKP
jgi:hypothetical protein